MTDNGKMVDECLTRRRAAKVGSQGNKMSRVARRVNPTTQTAGLWEKPRNTRVVWLKGREARRTAAISNQETPECVATAMLRTAGGGGMECNED